MSSILVNNTALTALQSLRMTQQELATTQNQISSGLAIGSAADNAATWSIAQTMTSDQGVYTQLSSNLSQTNSQLNVATAAVNSAITVMNSIKTDLAQAQNSGADTAAIATSLAQLSAQLSTIVNSASFNGVNLLDSSQGATLNVTATYNDGETSTNTAAGTVTASSIGTISIDLGAGLVTPTTGGATGTGLLQTASGTGSKAATDFTAFSISSAGVYSTALTNALSAAATTGSTGSNLSDTLNNADAAIQGLTNFASTLGAAQSRVESQNDFLQSLNSALTTGVGALVDADMNQASTRLQALQTQQQLGIQSLSISNQNAQMILKLFQ
jgi:flagellin